jgi:4-amino-4-deoxy-L-arabinose transferase-like glycosyltransferase
MLRRNSREPKPSRALGRDLAACAVLLMATVFYLLHHWPRDFYTFDEGLYLYEAKRVLDGEVMYRDFFEILTPAWFYFVAGLYWLFGASLDTARMGMAVVHGLIVVLVYVLSRGAGARPLIAACAALVHPTAGYPTCSIATPHWFATFLTLLLLLAMLDRPATTVPRGLLWGALTGVLILVQQHKGFVMAVGVGLVLLIDQLRRGRGGVGLGIRRGAAFFVGLVAVVGPVMLAFVVAAGFGDVFRALVLHPFVNYRRIHDAGSLWNVYLTALRFDGLWFQGVPDLVPLVGVLIYLPLTLPLAALVTVWQWRKGTTGTPRLALVLLVTGSFGLLSVAYNPNPIHLAFIVPVWAVLAAHLLEGLIRAMEDKVRAVRVVVTALAVMLIAGAGWQLGETAQARRRFFPLPTETAFGRIDFSNEHDVEVYRWLARLLRPPQVEEIFSFPANPGLYLLTGTRNPTRYQIVLPDYTDQDQIEEIVARLEAGQVRYVVQSFYWGAGQLTVLNQYLRRHYEWVRPPAPLGRLPMLKTYRRRSEEPTPPQAFF